MNERGGTLAAVAHNAARMMVGFLYLQHGAQKLFGVLGGFGGRGARVHLFSLFGLAGVLELFGGSLVLIGLFTRPVAFVLAGEMAVAYFWAHFPRAFLPIQNRGELPVLFCFFFLLLVAVGPGKASLDAWFRGRARGGIPPAADASG
ncbi:MAG: DoxX family protein [Gemmatimonadota bacterium]